MVAAQKAAERALEQVAEAAKAKAGEEATERIKQLSQEKRNRALFDAASNGDADAALAAIAATADINSKHFDVSTQYDFSLLPSAIRSNDLIWLLHSFFCSSAVPLLLPLPPPTSHLNLPSAQSMT